MINKKNQVIEVTGKTYQLTKMDARTGSYVAFKIAGVLAPSSGQTAEMTTALMSMPRKDFDELQSLLLRTVNRLVDNGKGQQLPEPVLKSNGDFVDADLAYDAASVIQLTIRALIFNVGGFFAAAGLDINLAELTDKTTNQ